MPEILIPSQSCLKDYNNHPYQITATQIRKMRFVYKHIIFSTPLVFLRLARVMPDILTLSKSAGKDLQKHPY